MAGESLNIELLAIPAVSALIIFLSYTSQLLFLFLEPGALSTSETWKFNILVGCIWICYYRACTVDPGRVPKDWEPSKENKSAQDDTLREDDNHDASVRQRWCRKCSALKPPRAHHCKKCQRCIPKMDHHCPWTCNCVSNFTLPHFVRFLFYAVVSMTYLESFIFKRIGVIWGQRTLPSYLGPSIPALAHLFILVVVNSLTLFSLVILLIRTIWSLGSNITTIESWEIERHKTLLRRARYFGGYLDGPDGVKVRIQKQEFPYDIGILSNIRDGMGGTWNILSWFWPFAATPGRESGLDFEVNGFEDRNLSWPPPDPDRIPRRPRALHPGMDPFTMPHFESTSDEIEAFRKRQEEDLTRRGLAGPDVRRRKKFHERHELRRKNGQTIIEDDDDDEEEGEEVEKVSNSGSYDHIDIDEGEEAWRDSEGQRLGDYGVDEDIEFYDEDDVPLSVVRERIKARD
ncbi:putative palmitoyltransferase with autoacylation activity Pfa4 [Talaromyces proteolyticus]|uniref:Palmitoyltransferase PFA4 n=1 Tax=Talaromyces proteolyticus TaxID=1131652 RepID=A0AAD4KNQ1_9EURO|nr:putative palmitoyltransferase with autoacylation activity Pfa4 [Talaromyces proteolyticus]KAH8692120.1 putative palmitoyltransferase with autoacylation activity Pfa4 [Talaromyces proteolyticus]